ncbi:ketopantoate reductase family protein [Anaeromyxobacter sp. Fw109-5]|uniref:ketopantoate reductase family protein n=1 Tax=Anaeromyxobacter sp. (strain Fw109-5) TaxID=404589 RepID=UPI0000ED75AF|nr:2-dehydropantoate 2-reductase [Anaeromyxobacter sp. Fw109-5]ABS26582.1 2-dehydropantoate 2-reductase [Anaeromyxobacter sp. Fw109-5]
MRIVVVGAGGVGGLLAGLLARAGVQVGVVARGAHLEAIRSEGIAVESPLGTFTARVAAEPAPGALGPADAVLVAVKSWQVPEVAPSLTPLLAGGGVAVPLQNGVEAAGQLAQVLGPERVAGGTIAVLAWIAGAGRVQHVGSTPRLALGERGDLARAPSPRLEALAAALRAAGAEAAVTPDIEAAVWEKFLFVEPLGAIGAVSRAPIGVVRSVPETRQLLALAQEEVAALARARGVALPPDAAARALARVDTVQADGTISMQRDLGAGRASELADQTGAVVRLARAAGVAAPVHETLLAALLPQELAARGRIEPFART